MIKVLYIPERPTPNPAFSSMTSGTVDFLPLDQGIEEEEQEEQKDDAKTEATEDNLSIDEVGEEEETTRTVTGRVARSRSTSPIRVKVAQPVTPYPSPARGPGFPSTPSIHPDSLDLHVSDNNNNKSDQKKKKTRIMIEFSKRSR